MTKADVINDIAKKTGIDRKDVTQVVELFMDTIKESMVQGNDVFLRGFGSFVVRERAEKTARNISKQTTIIIPKHKVPTFKPSKIFTALFTDEK
ncbi:MAG: HU family DNA-binding protein [Porphyromonas sp.]|nr:HU family DNA-binding protein [Porphyromonas sp.]